MPVTKGWDRQASQMGRAASCRRWEVVIMVSSRFKIKNAPAGYPGRGMRSIVILHLFDENSMLPTAGMIQIRFQGSRNISDSQPVHSDSPIVNSL